MEDWLNGIRQRSLSGKPIISGGRSSNPGRFSFDDLVFIPKQLKGRPLDYFREEIILFSELWLGMTDHIQSVPHNP